MTAVSKVVDALAAAAGPPSDRGGEFAVWKVKRGAVVVFAGAFKSPRPPGMVLRHKNGRNDDDRVRNLTWGTQKQNMADKWRHGTHQAGEQSGMAKLTNDIVRAIRASSKSSYALAAEYGVSSGCIWSARTRRTWAHVA